MYKKGVDFIIINFYGIDYVTTLVDSIHKYTDVEYTIYIINNGEMKVPQVNTINWLIFMRGMIE